MLELAVGLVIVGLSAWLTVLLVVLAEARKNEDLNDDCGCDRCETIQRLAKENKW